MEFLKQKRVLVVDDEEEIRDLIADELTECEAIAETAGSVSEALEKIQASDYNAVISDIRMPGGSAKRLLLEVRELKKEIPHIFLMSGFSDLNIEEAYELGAEGLFKKPLNLEALLYRLNQALQPIERRWARNSFRAEVQLQIKVKLSQDVEETAKTANVGRGGLFVRLEKDFYPDINDRVGFDLNAGSYGEISGVGVVRWVRRSPELDLPTGFGMEFEDIESESLASLYRLVNDLHTKAFIPMS